MTKDERFKYQCGKWVVFQHDMTTCFRLQRIGKYSTESFRRGKLGIVKIWRSKHKAQEFADKLNSMPPD
jgi:hypothetical protein